MAYNFSDLKGKIVATGPSINGLRELKAFVEEQPPAFPAMRALLEHGYTKLLTQLKIDCRNLAKRAKDNKDVMNSILEIGKGADKAEEILIMED